MDPHSFSNPHQIRIKHVDLELAVSFDKRTIHGVAVLFLEHPGPEHSELVLDSLDLNIIKVECSHDGSDYQTANFSLGERHPIFGSPLKIELRGNATRVRIEYLTSPDARGLQWLEPDQTSAKTDPFLLTQSQAINARSWVPLQDSPAVRMTYRATINCPGRLMAVMGAGNNPSTPQNGRYDFEMPQPIPSYLFAFAVGNLAFKSLGPRSGVYAEQPLIEMAGAEFSDLELMMETTERLYGPYRWNRYDILVLPSGFPLGGMENPRLTFATPTIIAGDKSLVSLVTHELAHSWAGNLVTNATWNDFWLNEGFSVYVERRVVEEIYGPRRAEMETMLGRQDLEEELARLPAEDQILAADLEGRDPDDCVTKVPYEKGALFLRQLEEVFGRSTFDSFLRRYFDDFAFKSITTAEFVSYLSEHLFANDKRSAAIPVREWLFEPGLPASAPRPSSKALTDVRSMASQWLHEHKSARWLKTSNWTAQEWLQFLRCMPPDLTAERLRELDEEFSLTASGNSEIASQWLLAAIRADYKPAVERLDRFLIQIGREKLIEPLYKELVKSPAGRKHAGNIYRQARGGYHPLVARRIDRLLNQ